jgi:prepilin-type N-terminal cleavage/methylation domain-containing protein
MKRARRRTRGFTLIEVMLAIGIMTIGAVAIMGMLRASTLANTEARILTNATQNTQMWVDRLQRLSLRWTTNTQAGVAGIPYLAALSNGTDTGFIVPGTANGADGIAGLDWQGTPAGAANARFCTLVRLAWISSGESMRADVITYYPRRSFDPVTGGASAFTCTAGASGSAIVTELGTANSRFGSVRSATLLRWSPLQ